MIFAYPSTTGFTVFAVCLRHTANTANPVVVAGEVGPVLAVAEDAEEGDDDGGVAAPVAGLPQAALGLVPAPEDDDHLAGRLRGCCLLSGEDDVRRLGRGVAGPCDELKMMEAP